MNIRLGYTTITLGYAVCEVVYASKNFWSRYVPDLA
jgi:hypothetical protein